MQFHKIEQPFIPFIEQSTPLQDYAAEVKLLHEKRQQLDDQRARLDLEQAELNRQTAILQLKYALLDNLYHQLDQREALLTSEQENLQMISDDQGSSGLDMQQ